MSPDISKNNEKLIQLSKEVTNFQISIDISQQIVEAKMKALEQNFEKERKESIDCFKSIEVENKDLKHKLRDLEDSSRRDSLRFDGIREYEKSRGVILRNI